MKHLKLFEKYQNFEEVEDFLLELIEDGVITPNTPAYENFEYRMGREWTHIQATYVINFKENVESLEDLEYNINILNSLKNPIKFAELPFSIDKFNILNINIPVSDNIKNFVNSLQDFQNHHEYNGYKIDGAFIGVDWMRPNKDFSVNVCMKGKS